MLLAFGFAGYFFRSRSETRWVKKFITPVPEHFLRDAFGYTVRAARPEELVHAPKIIAELVYRLKLPRNDHLNILWKSTAGGWRSERSVKRNNKIIFKMQEDLCQQIG